MRSFLVNKKIVIDLGRRAKRSRREQEREDRLTDDLSDDIRALYEKQRKTSEQVQALCNEGFVKKQDLDGAVQKMDQRFGEIEKKIDRLVYTSARMSLLVTRLKLPTGMCRMEGVNTHRYAPGLLSSVSEYFGLRYQLCNVSINAFDNIRRQ